MDTTRIGISQTLKTTALARKGVFFLAIITALSPAQTQKTVAELTAPTPSVWVDVADMGRKIDIHVGNKLRYRTISLAARQVPSFDKDDVGEAANPATDYRFDPKATLDPFRNVIYFSVHNLATAGNANADRALFSYSLETNALAGPLSIREMSVSYGILVLSPDGRYLAFSDGGHGGMCADTMGFTVLNLETRTEVATLFLPAGSVGRIDFVAWTTPNTFKYQEISWRSYEDCLNSNNPTAVDKLLSVN